MPLAEDDLLGVTGDTLHSSKLTNLRTFIYAENSVEKASGIPARDVKTVRNIYIARLFGVKCRFIYFI